MADGAGVAGCGDPNRLVDGAEEVCWGFPNRLVVGAEVVGCVAPKRLLDGADVAGFVEPNSPGDEGAAVDCVGPNKPVDGADDAGCENPNRPVDGAEDVGFAAKPKDGAVVDSPMAVSGAEVTAGVEDGGPEDTEPNGPLPIDAPKLPNPPALATWFCPEAVVVWDEMPKGFDPVGWAAADGPPNGDEKLVCDPVWNGLAGWAWGTEAPKPAPKAFVDPETPPNMGGFDGVEPKIPPWLGGFGAAFDGFDPKLKAFAGVI